MLSWERLRGLFWQIVRFGFVGVFAATLDYTLLAVIVHFGGSRYFARIFSVAVAMVATWALNRTITFPTSAPPSWREFFHYIAVATIGSLLNICIYWGALWLGASTLVAFIIGTLLTAIFSFIRYRALLGDRKVEVEVEVEARP